MAVLVVNPVIVHDSARDLQAHRTPTRVQQKWDSKSEGQPMPIEIKHWMSMLRQVILDAYKRGIQEVSRRPPSNQIGLVKIGFALLACFEEALKVPKQFCRRLLPGRHS